MNIFCSADNYETIDEVKDVYPGAAIVIEVEGGWMVFETVTDYETWQNQV